MKKTILPRLLTLLMFPAALLQGFVLPVEAEEPTHDHDAIAVNGSDYCKENPDSINHVWNNGICSWCGTTCTHGYGSDGNCTICGMPHDHQLYETGRAEAACTENGFIVYTCSICGSQMQDSLPAAGHISENVPALDPTYTEEGHTAGTRCSRCGETLSGLEVIPVLEQPECEKSESGKHIAEEIPAFEAACTENGMTAGTRCIACGQTLSGLDDIPAGHVYREDPAVSPTCTKEGRSSGRRCTRCGQSEGYESLPAAGHHWHDGTCTVCGMAEPVPVQIEFGTGTGTGNDSGKTITRTGTPDSNIQNISSAPVVIVRFVDQKSAGSYVDSVKGEKEQKTSTVAGGTAKSADDPTEKCSFMGATYRTHDWKSRYTNEICIRCQQTRPHQVVRKPDSIVNEFCVCENCGNIEHHWELDKGARRRRCTKCEGFCNHRSGFKVRDGKDVCRVCGVSYEHNWEKGTCTRCFKNHGSHNWKDNGQNCLCTVCGKEQAHKRKNKNGTCICTKCGNTTWHAWRDGGKKNCRCEVCGKKKKHSWKSAGSKEVCTGCEKLRNHDWKKSDRSCICKQCGVKTDHSWKNDGKKDKCTRCGEKKNHDLVFVKSSRYCQKCRDCHETSDHSFKDKNGWCVCRECGAKQEHQWVVQPKKLFQSRKMKCDSCGKTEKM